MLTICDGRQLSGRRPGSWSCSPLSSSYNSGVAPPSTFWGSIFAILAAALALHPSPFIVNACTRYLGTISYSGYLVHFAVLDVAGRILRHSSALTRYPILHLTVLYAAVVGGTVLVATATNRLVENPHALPVAG